MSLKRIQKTVANGRINQLTDLNHLGVIMPVFNEAQTIDEIVRRVLSQPCVFELIIVNDGSKDGTPSVLQSWLGRDQRVKLLNHACNRGKGAAIRTGIAFSQAPVIIIQDGDLEYDPADYAKMLGPIINGCADVVYGSRFNTVKNENPLWHSFGNRCLTWCSNLASGLTLTDEATCYKMFRREVFDMVSLEEDGFGFCPEITAKISKLRVRIVEVPISYSGRTRAQGKKIRLSDGWNAVKCIVKYNFCQRSPKPAHIVSKWTAST